MFDDLQNLLISLGSDWKYFYDVELLYPFDEFQTIWILYREHTKKKTSLLLRGWHDKSDVFVFFISLLKIQFVWNSLSAFAVILPQQRPVVVSVYAQNFFGWSLARKKLQGNANCSDPKAVIGLNKVANERYLPYLQHCGNAFYEFSFVAGVKVAQSYIK